MVSKTLHHLVPICHHPIMQHTKPLQFLLISVGVGQDALSAYNDYWLTPLFPSGVILEIIFSRKLSKIFGGHE